MSRPKSNLSCSNRQDIICSVIESKGISPTVGISLLNLDSAEVILCQISDNQSYARTIQKLNVYGPFVILLPHYSNNASSQLHTILEEHLLESTLTFIERHYFSEQSGSDYLKNLTFVDDYETLMISIRTCYFSKCCFGALISYIISSMSIKFPSHSLKVTYTPPEGSMIIDNHTINSLEIIQNIENQKSNQCLFGILNLTKTPMGSRLLRTNLLQPSTDLIKINSRLEAVEELIHKQTILQNLREHMKNFVDAEKILTNLIIIPEKSDGHYRQQSINRIMMLKRFLSSVQPLFECIEQFNSNLLISIQNQCNPDLIDEVYQLIQNVVDDDVMYAKTPLEYKNQRIYAIKSSVNGFIDIVRQAYREAQDDSYTHFQNIIQDHQIEAELKYDSQRSFFIKVHDFNNPNFKSSNLFINKVNKKGKVECQTLELLKWNQKIDDCEKEIISQCEKVIGELISKIIIHMQTLYRCCESIALLDMLCSFAELALRSEFTKPILYSSHPNSVKSLTFAIKSAMHPIKMFHVNQWIPNDIYSTPLTRFQLISGSNMSGKSTYLKMIPLLTIMAQIGSFIPAIHVSIPIIYRICTRISHSDDGVQDNVSSFSKEMKEVANILNSNDIDRNSTETTIVMIDELGRNTSKRDGLAISIAVSEALIQSKVYCWFVTHLNELLNIFNDKPGVINMHMSTSLTNNNGAQQQETQQQKLQMNYILSPGISSVPNYGIIFAKIFPLPLRVLNTAEIVAKSLTDRINIKKNQNGGELNQIKKRKLLIGLEESLNQAKHSSLSDEELRGWLISLQIEFIKRMEELS